MDGSNSRPDKQIDQARIVREMIGTVLVQTRDPMKKSATFTHQHCANCVKRFLVFEVMADQLPRAGSAFVVELTSWNGSVRIFVTKPAVCTSSMMNNWTVRNSMLTAMTSQTRPVVRAHRAGGRRFQICGKKYSWGGDTPRRQHDFALQIVADLDVFLLSVLVDDVVAPRLKEKCPAAW
jgi:hypothetical protein